MIRRRKIKVLVVDDSAFMRKALKRMLASDPVIQVVGDAKDGEGAIQEVIHLKPDVVTLDVKMFGMDGLEALKRIMEERPTPVLMVSSLTSEGGKVTLEALEAGAVDFIDKSSCYTNMDILNIADTLIEKVKVIAGVDVKKLVKPEATPKKPKPIAAPLPLTTLDGIPTHLVTIGSSTGGPTSLERVLNSLPDNYPGALLVVQHMPQGFTGPLADRLNQQCPMTIREANEDDLILPGHVYIAPAGYHLKIRRSVNQYRVVLSKNPKDTPHCPSVDVMMESVAKVWPGRMLGVIMTGMGSDGTRGARLFKYRGAEVIAQNEQTCVVYGMPRSAHLAGYVDRLVALHVIASEIIHFH